jgi:signal transduction histidine kinase
MINKELQQASDIFVNIRTGLGLAIIKAYIEKLGGKISVISEFGKGSTFSFKLSYKAYFEDKNQ